MLKNIRSIRLHCIQKCKKNILTFVVSCTDKSVKIFYQKIFFILVRLSFCLRVHPGGILVAEVSQNQTLGQSVFFTKVSVACIITEAN